MGVTGLWTILAPVKEHKVLGSLQGETLAVDLSIWVCETKCVKQMQGTVIKPYLRNLFFRVSHLTQLGVKLVFVIDGQAPELKWQEMSRRQQALGRGRGSRTGKGSRSNFNRNVKECCELLDILGIPYVQSRGEAEAMCAALNACGLVDACITDDGDAFLYGARKVYRNFTMNSKDPHVESYSMASIETNLGLNREKLVAMALLLGCDYLPGGVHGVGLERVVKLMSSLSHVDVLKRFENWAMISPKECFDKVEIFVRQKALVVSGFPQKQVITEFLNSRETTPSRPFSWRRPLMQRAQSFAEVKLEWVTDYTLEKVLPLVTLWDLTHISLSKHSASHHLQAHRIVKTRVRHGVSVYEVEWYKEAMDTSYSKDYYITLEEQSLFTRCFPDVVDKFIASMTEAKENKKKGSRKKTKAVKDLSVEDLVSQVNAISLDQPSKHSVSACDKQNLDILVIDDEKKKSLKVEQTATMKGFDQSKLNTKKVEMYSKYCTDIEEVKSRSKICNNVQPVVLNKTQPITSNNVEPVIFSTTQTIISNIKANTECPIFSNNEPLISNVVQNTVYPIISNNVQPTISNVQLTSVNDITSTNVNTACQIVDVSDDGENDIVQYQMIDSDEGETNIVQHQMIQDSDDDESDEEIVLSLTQRLQLKLQRDGKHSGLTSLNVSSRSLAKSASQELSGLTSLNVSSRSLAKSASQELSGLASLNVCSRSLAKSASQELSGLTSLNVSSRSLAKSASQELSGLASLNVCSRSLVKSSSQEHPGLTNLNVCSQSLTKSASQEPGREASRREKNSNMTGTKRLTDPLKNSVDLENSTDRSRVLGKGKGIVGVERIESKTTDLQSVGCVRSDNLVLRSPAQFNTKPTVSQTQAYSEESLRPENSLILRNQTEFHFSENVSSECSNSYVDLKHCTQKENLTPSMSSNTYVDIKHCNQNSNSFVNQKEIREKENVLSSKCSDSLLDQAELCEEETIISSGGFNRLSLKYKSQCTKQKHKPSLVENNKTNQDVCTLNSPSHDFSHLLGMTTSFPTPDMDHSTKRQVRRPSQTRNTMYNSMSPNSTSKTIDEYSLQSDTKLAKSISIDFGNFCMQTSLLKDLTRLASPCQSDRDDSLVDCSSNKTPQCTLQKDMTYFNSPLLFDSPEKSFCELNQTNPHCSSPYSCGQPDSFKHCQTLEEQNYEKQMSECSQVYVNRNSEKLMIESKVQPVHNNVCKNNQEQEMKGKQVVKSEYSEAHSLHSNVCQSYENRIEHLSKSEHTEEHPVPSNKKSMVKQMSKCEYSSIDTCRENSDDHCNVLSSRHNQFVSVTSVSLNNRHPTHHKQHLLPDVEHKEMFLELDVVKSELDDTDVCESDTEESGHHLNVNTKLSDPVRETVACDKSVIKVCDTDVGMACNGNSETQNYKSSGFYSTDDSVINSPVPLCLADRLGCRLTKNAQMALQSMSQK